MWVLRDSEDDASEKQPQSFGASPSATQDDDLKEGYG
jgi:hypothetical protein